MLKVRSILSGLLVAFALCAFASTSALASTHAFFIEGTEIGAKEKTEDLTIPTFFKLESKISSVRVLLECEGDMGTGNFEEKGKTTGEVKLKECALYEITLKGKEEDLSACSLPESIEFKYKDELIAGPEDELKPEGEKETFVKIEVAGSSCALKGTYALSGAVVCQLPVVGVEMPEHNLICDTNKLKLASEPAELYSEGTVKLTSGKEWYAN